MYTHLPVFGGRTTGKQSGELRAFPAALTFGSMLIFCIFNSSHAIQLTRVKKGKNKAECKLEKDKLDYISHKEEPGKRTSASTLGAQYLSVHLPSCTQSGGRGGEK